MTVPAYTNIAHFRAPYKNSYVYTGVGQDEVPVAPPAGPPPPDAMDPARKELMKHITVGKNGQLSWNTDTANLLRKALKGYGTVHLSNEAVKVIPFTPVEMNAATADPKVAALLEARSGATWVNQRAAEGKVVFASVGMFVPGAGEKNLAALDPADRERVDATSRLMPILAVPGAVSPPTPGKVTPTSKASIFQSPAALAVGVVVVGGVGMAVYRGFKSKKRLPPIKV